MTEPCNLAFLGIGLTGGIMARRLIAAGFPTTLWDSASDEAAAVASIGGTVAASPADAVRDAHVVLTKLGRNPAVADIIFAETTAQTLQPGTVVIDMSLISPSEVRENAARLAELRVAHIDAPISGGVRGAEFGSLAIVAGGDPAVFARVEHLLRVLGRPIRVGPAGTGQLTRLANQIIVGATIGALAEALVLTEQGGADPINVRKALRAGFAESRVLELQLERMVARNFTTKTGSAGQLSALEDALDTARALDLKPMPYSTLTADLLRTLVERSGDIDHSAMILELERRCGTASLLVD